MRGRAEIVETRKQREKERVGMSFIFASESVSLGAIAGLVLGGRDKTANNDTSPLGLPSFYISSRPTCAKVVLIISSVEGY